MITSENHIKPLAKRVLGLFGLRPVQAVQVLYLDRLNLAFLVVSKNGCSSVKESLVSTAFGDIDLPFEKVHKYLSEKRQVLEGHGLQIHAFSSRRKLSSFLEGKSVLVIQRPVLARVKSVWGDYKTAKNKMIFPVFPDYSLKRCRDPRWDFNQFVEVICGINDLLSDRHYRSQSFFWDAIPEGCQLIRLNLNELQESFSQHPLLSELVPPRQRNRSLNAPGAEISPTLVNLLKERYADDIRQGIPLV